jgi:hypothetical protein
LHLEELVDQTQEEVEVELIDHLHQLLEADSLFHKIQFRRFQLQPYLFEYEVSALQVQEVLVLSLVANQGY